MQDYLDYDVKKGNQSKTNFIYIICNFEKFKFIV